MKNRFMTAGDVFVCDFGETYGNEQSGTRLCVCVSNAKMAAYSPVVYVVPITSKDKPDVFSHYKLYNKQYPSFNAPVSTVLCEQLRSIDKDRCREKLCRLSEYDLYNIIVRIKKNLTF